jgi:hypothetical protein
MSDKTPESQVNVRPGPAKADSSEISVVIQGPVAPVTADIIRTFRRIRPGAEIMLSTWAGEDAPGLGADKTVFSQDPGSLTQNGMINGQARRNNVNRQIVSSLAGLRAAARPYALKTRSDVFIESAGWLDYFGRYDRQSPPPIFNRRVLLNYCCSRNPRRIPMPFHWSDWVFFGETADLLDIFDIPLMGNEDAAWFASRPRRSILYSDNLNRYVPEQWICSMFLRKHRPLQFDCLYDATPENIALTERFLAENTVILDKRHWGLRFVKYNTDFYLIKSSLLHFRDWHILYRKYALGEEGPYWLNYRLRCFLVKLFQHYLRFTLLAVLVKLGLKERLRAFLVRRGRPS